MITTERLILRPFKQSDFESVHAYASVPQNIIYMGWGPNDENTTKNFLKVAEQKWHDNPIYEYELAVTLKDNGKVIGGCGIYLNKERNEGNLGWILHRDYWKKGYGTELSKALIKYGFEQLKLHRIYAACNTDNYGSYRVMEHSGMRKEAHFIKNRFGRVGDINKWFDEYIYAILDDEYR